MTFAQSTAPAANSHQETRSAGQELVEAYRLLRQNLLFALADSQSRTVVFSGAGAETGKSTLCSNLAIVMAQAGSRVAVIDADLRRPAQHRNFRVEPGSGLSAYLGGFCRAEDCLLPQAVPGVDLIPAGATPPNPEALLGGARMRSLLAALSARYDCVFLDTPPVLSAPDALTAAAGSAGIVLAARQHRTAYRELRACAEAIRQNDVPLLGVVVTGMNSRPPHNRRSDRS